MFMLFFPNGGGLWIMVVISLFALSNRRLAMNLVIVFKKYLPYLFMANLALTTIITGLIINERKQFLPTVIFLTRTPFPLIIYQIQFILSVFMFATILTKLFFGRLHESEWIYVFACFSEALTEAVFVLTVFRRSINHESFISVLISLLFLKTFHWLVAKRIDTFQRNLTDNMTSHLRIILIWLLLFFVDFILLSFSAIESDKPVNTIFATIFFEVIVMIISLVKVIFKHFLIMIEIFVIGRGNEFRFKTAILLLVTLLVDVIRLMVYCAYIYKLFNDNVVPLFLAHSISFVLIDFANDIKTVLQGWQAIHYMRNCANAQPEELRNSNICVICREEMTDSAKKLPCGHIFHRICLILWYMQKQTCPVCRLNIRQYLFRINLNIFNRRQHEAANEPQQTAHITRNAQTVPAGTAANNINRIIPMPFGHGPVPFFNRFYVPESMTTPLNLTNYTDEQLEALEKTMRANVLQKLELMRQMISHLDAADYLMSVYRSSLTRTESGQQDAPRNSNENSTT